MRNKESIHSGLISKINLIQYKMAHIDLVEFVKSIN